MTTSCLADALGSVNINFTANIVTWSCTISTSSQDITVNLGSWATNAFSSSGQETTPEPFSIELSDCNNTSVTTTFSGSSDSKNSDYLALASSSTASNVAIEIKNSDKTMLALNTESSAVTVGSSGDATLSFYANYVTTANTVNAGTANADATFIINYY